MARPFAHTFEKDQSPLSPQSPAPATPISYKTNVNRQKTKKWTEAKPIDYGGDDWGDEDDEFATPMEQPPPPPVAKPTGLRQAGQGIQGAPKLDPPGEGSKKAYGELPPLPGASGSTRPRANSFDSEDEQRNFSNTTIRQPAPGTSQALPTLYSQMSNDSTKRVPSGHQPLSISTAPAAGQLFSSPYQARPDFLPSAVPSPLTTRTSAGPSATSADGQGKWFPPRKSSLSQEIPADVGSYAPEIVPPRPWAGGRSSSPGDRSSSPGAAPRAPLPISSAPKAPTFIRPADIYRRMEEEREKERQSMESGRPSMDLITPAGNNVRSASPATSLTREGPEGAAGGRRRSSLDGDDASESGRRLMPMLEPVKERKSEYGFDGFNVNDPKLQGKFDDKSPEVRQGDMLSDSEKLEAENNRPQSVSPKLPDLYRMSGFGLEMFSPKTDEHTESAVQTESSTIPAPASNLSPSQDNDQPLRKEPSLGFTSVVHQAFDPPNDSVPATPASISGSGVKRSDSESTGTAGISPIMSRVPSSAVAEGRNRETSTPAILESVNEPESPPPAGENAKSPQGIASRHAEPVPQPFKPGHRRDISTPSPGNSPARSPDVGEAKGFPLAEQATITSAALEDDDEPLQAPRPIAEREGSFRPVLPGGWTSYATTARSTTPQSEAAQVPVDRDQSVTTDMPPPPQPLPKGGDGVLPRESQRPSANSVVAAAGLVAASGAGALALGKHEDEKSTVDSKLPKPPSLRGNSALPTPDPNMAPSGNVYSTTKLDPRLTSLPSLEHAPAETQLRPDVVNRDISADSSAAPTPPRKDTPCAASDDSSGYFPHPTVPLKAAGPDQGHGSDLTDRSTRPPALPPRNIDTKPYDEEIDKLQKGIVKSLSTRQSEGSPTERLAISSDAVGAEANRESTYLPSEYDSYWASTADDVEDSGSKRSSRENTNATPAAVFAAAPVGVNVKGADSSTHLDDKVDDSSPLKESGRATVPPRFSWEASSIAEDKSTYDLAPSFPVTGREETISHSGSKEIGIGFPVLGSDQPVSHSSAASSVTPNNPTILSEPAMSKQDVDAATEPERVRRSPDTSKEDHTARDAALGASAATVAAGIAYSAHPNSVQTTDTPKRRLSLAEEKAGGPSVSSYPVSQTPPEDEHPARSPEVHLLKPADNPSVNASHESVSPVSSAEKAFSSHTGRILSFKEILSLKTSQERVHAFDETRHRVASMESGLGEWVASLQAQHEEHQMLGASWNGSRTSASKSQPTKGSGLGHSQAQQPYFQQYLNASSPTSPTSSATAQPTGPHTPMGTQQGLSPASGKITTQQVQAKGKEFLHTAGVFGGKAGKAGLGLLAKGKSRFRGSGAGEKTNTPPNSTPVSTPNSKSERRSSWGFPVNMSRSFGRAEGSPRTASRENTSSADVDQRNRSNTLTSLTGSPKRPTHRSTASTSSIGLGGLNVGTAGAASSSSLLTSRDKETSPLPPVPATDSGPQLASTEKETPPLPAASPFSPSTLSASLSKDIPPLPSADASSSIYTPMHTQTTATPAANSESGDYLNAAGLAMRPPLPISKSQPSWDPFNATPIFEEEFMYDERVERGLGGSNVNGLKAFRMADETRTHEEGKLMVPRGDDTKSARSSEDTQQTPFYDAPGDPMDLPEPERQRESVDKSKGEEWVMVDKEEEEEEEEHTPREVTPNFASDNAEVTVRELQDDNDTERSETPAQEDLKQPEHVEQKLPSILNRPRGSFDVPSVFVPSHHPRTSQSVPHHATHGETTEQANRGLPYSPAVHDSDRHEPHLTSDRPLLPPIRRSTTLEIEGISPDIDSRPKQTADETALNSRIEKPLPQPAEEQEDQSAARFGTGVTGIVSKAAALVGVGKVKRSKEDNLPRIPAAEPQEDPAPQQYRSRGQSPGHSRPPLHHTGSSEYSLGSQQRTITPNQGGGINVPRAADVNPQESGFRRSQDAWRPNAVNSSSYMPGNKWGDDYVNVPRYSFEQSQRPSLESARPRGQSISSSNGQRLSGYIPRPEPSPQMRPFDQPPSSAQRYPALFQAVPAPDMPHDNADLPDHYYQAPLGREEVFLPRTQTNEYQLPGVGPPEETRPEGRRRSSSLFRDIRGKISRGASRERQSASRDPYADADSPSPRLDSGWRQETAGVEKDATDRSKRRSSFFSALSGTSGVEPPQSRESTIVHRPDSAADLLTSNQPSPIKKEDRKRSFFGNNSTAKQKKVSRASTSNVEENGKKRFSGLGGFFGIGGQGQRKSSVPPTERRPQATRELSQPERQPLDSPPLQNQHFAATEPRQYHPVPDPPPSVSQPRNVLTKPASNPPSNGKNSPSSRQQSRTRRSSGSLLSGLGLISRRSQKTDRDRDRDDSPGRSEATNPPHHLPPAQTYTDLQEQERAARESSGHQSQLSESGALPWQEAGSQPPERGRRVSRQATQEPVYDAVPIPGGYRLVRGQGARAVPTEYDPRGISHLAQDSNQQSSAYTNGSGYGYSTPPKHFSTRANTTALQNSAHHNLDVAGGGRSTGAGRDINEPHRLPSVPRNLEYDDDAGRSPDSQQRPWLLSLPGDEPPNDGIHEPPLRGSSQPSAQVFISPPPQQQRARPHHPVIHRLQTGNSTLQMQRNARLPSPASYALPPSTTSSPRPGSASGSAFSFFKSKPQAVSPAPFPPSPSFAGPVPPPKSGPGLGDGRAIQALGDDVAQNQSLGQNLEIQRSSTHRTTVSDVSQLSSENSPSARNQPLPFAPQQQPQAPPHPMDASSREVDAADLEGGAARSIVSTGAVSIQGQGQTTSSLSMSTIAPVASNPSLPLRKLQLEQQHSESMLGPEIRETVVERSGSPDLYDATPRGGNENNRGKDNGMVQGKHQKEDRTEADDEMAQMSATSYPGQEWNPYGGSYGHGGHGASEEWDD